MNLSNQRKSFWLIDVRQHNYNHMHIMYTSLHVVTVTSFHWRVCQWMNIQSCLSHRREYVSEAEELGEWHRLPTGPLRGDLPKCCQFPVSVSRSSLASGFYFDFFPSIEACKNTKPVTLVFIYIPDFFQRKFVSLIHWGEKKTQYCWIEILYLMITSWSW